MLVFSVGDVISMVKASWVGLEFGVRSWRFGVCALPHVLGLW